MKIGIDVDGTLIDYYDKLCCQAELFDFLEKNNNQGKEDAYWVQDRHMWSKETWDEFCDKYLLKLTEESNLMPGAKEVLDLLVEAGHEIILVSARGIEYDEMITLVEHKIQEHNLKIYKYYWKATDKLKICKDENIDVMIDDDPRICENISNNGISTLYLRNIYGKKLPESKYLTEVHNWGNVYRSLKKINDTKNC